MSIQLLKGLPIASLAIGKPALAEESAAPHQDVSEAAKASTEHSATASHAGSDRSHEAHGPGWDVGLQAINFGVFALLIVLVARNKVRAFFTGRESSFRESLQKAAAAKREAEQKKREIQERISRLESTADSSVEQARAEAELLKSRMMAEAEALRGSLKEDAERTIGIELERAKAELRAEMIAKAMELAQATLSEKIAAADQKRLQTEFVEKIQVVRP